MAVRSPYLGPPGAYQMGPPPQYMPGRPGMMSVLPSRGIPMTHQSGGRLVSNVAHHSSRSDLVRKRLSEVPKAKAIHHGRVVKKRRLGDKMLSQNVRDLVPESRAYMDLLAFERKLDSTIMRKRLEIQEALKRPDQIKQKRKLRVFISHVFLPEKIPGENGSSVSVPEWELKIEGRLLDELGQRPDDSVRLRFSSFFRSVIIELDKEAYGPDNHLTEWHRGKNTEDIDGFTVTRPGEDSVKCTLILSLNYQPPQFKLSSKLAKLLGIHTTTKVDIINGIWQYIKNNRLQDPQEREFINNDKYFQQIFEVPRMKFTEIPRRLAPLLLAPDPIVIHHLINADAPEGKRTACYDIDVEIDDPVRGPMHSFLMSTSSQQEITSLDNKIHETVDQINAIKLQREFYLGFAHNPQKFINDWLASQSRDLKIMKDKVGNPEVERRANYYEQPWCDEAVPRYFYAKITQQRHQLENAMGIRH